MTDKTAAKSNVAQHPTATDEDKRRQLREKIAAGEQRNAERTLADHARDAAESAAGFVKRHPLATIAGGIAAGLIIGGLTRPGRRMARRVGGRGSALATVAADAALAYGLRMLDGANDLARSAGDKFEDFGDSVGTQARGLRRDAAYRADVTTDALHSMKRGAARKSSRALRDLRSRFTH